MMNKRGVYISIGGVAMIIISFTVAVSIIQDSGMDQGEFSLPDVLEGMFDDVSDKTQIMPGESQSFSFDASVGTKSLLWGMQMLDYQGDDSVHVSITNIYGDNFGQFDVNQPAFFETMTIEKSDIYNFNVENTGHGQVTIIMMFTKNPNDSDTFANPNSPMSTTLLPLAVSGTLLIVGIIVVVVGVIIMIFDYKKRRSEFI